MKKNSLLITVFLISGIIFGMAFSCNQGNGRETDTLSTRTAIVGLWQTGDGPNSSRFNFRDDGRIIATAGSVEMEGGYEFVSDDTIRMKIGESRQESYKVKITGDTMRLTQVSDNSIQAVYKRVVQ